MQHICISATRPLPVTPTCVHMYSSAGLIRRTPPPTFSGTAVTDRHSDTTFSSSGLTGCGYRGLMDRKNHSDMCRCWTLDFLRERRIPYPLGQALRVPDYLYISICDQYITPQQLRVFYNFGTLKIFYSSIRPCYLVCIALGIQDYQYCSNDDLGLTLTFLQQVQQWESANSLDSMEGFKDLA